MARLLIIPDYQYWDLRAFSTALAEISKQSAVESWQDVLKRCNGAHLINLTE